MPWLDVIAPAAALLGAVVGAVVTARAVLRAADRTHTHQFSRDKAAARIEYVWRKQAQLQPTLDGIVAAARRAIEACVNPDHDMTDSDIKELDATVDRLDTSALTREVAEVATEMRRGVVQYQAQMRLLLQLHEQMPTAGGPLRPDVGQQVARAGDQAEKFKDRVLSGAFETREAVKRLTAKLDAEQRGE